MMEYSKRSCGLVGAALMVLIAAGCSKPSYIELSPSNLEMERRSETQRIQGKAMNHQGRYFPEIMFEWASEDPSIATVDEVGNVRAVSAGRTHIVARHRDLDARARVTVTLVGRVEIAEPEVTLSKKRSRRYVPRVTLLDTHGEVLTGRRINISSRDVDIVGVDARGGLHARSPGETEVVIEVDGVLGIIEVTVAE